MGIRTFAGGVHPSTAKEATRDRKIRRAKLPERVIIPLQQHLGAPCSTLVSPGDRVKVGQKVGEASAFVSAPIHASISGEVKEIKPLLHPRGDKVLSVVIQSDGEDEAVEMVRRPGNFQSLSLEEIKGIIKEAGLVGLGGAAFPTHVKLSLPPGKRVDTYLLNGAECEPYLTGDYRLMVERPGEVIEGFRILMKAIGVRHGYLGIEENKPRAISALEKAMGNEPCLEIKVLKVKYPQGGEKQLIKAVLGREVPSGGLPFDVGVMVSNVGTAFACWEAVVLGKPLLERVVTVTGSGVKNPDNLQVRLGTSVADLLEECGGFKGRPGKLILGGPMMGLAQFTPEVPVIKGTSGILVQTREEVMDEETRACIRCGKCLEVCPLRLMPNVLTSFAEKNRFVEAEDYGVLDCIECGACDYQCPAKRPLVHLVKHAKAELARRER